MSAETRYHAALLLRWTAARLAGETQTIACTWPLEDAGYDLAELEIYVQDAAATALAIMECAPHAVEVSDV
jgi:hypothetical protein